MKPIFKYLVLLVILCTIVACPESPVIKGGFMFYNNSNSNVYIYLGVASRKNGGSLYPDTMLMNKNVTIGPISKNSKYYYDFNRFLDTDTLCFFIIDSDTINKYTWEEVKDGYKILQRYDLPVNLKGLKQLNFLVTYPPTEDMKDLHMYPLYMK